MCWPLKHKLCLEDGGFDCFMPLSGLIHRGGKWWWCCRWGCVQVQKVGPHNCLCSIARPPLGVRCDFPMKTLRKDPLHPKLGLATSMHVQAIFQMSVPPRPPGGRNPPSQEIGIEMDTQIHSADVWREEVGGLTYSHLQRTKGEDQKERQ